MTKDKKKHISYPVQRETCRALKFVYYEKCDACGMRILMCNYPFQDPKHKKGGCKASMCTDMRTLPDEVIEADEEKLGIALPNEHVEEEEEADSTTETREGE